MLYAFRSPPTFLIHFRAISDQLEGMPEHYDRIRQQCVSFIEENRDNFEPFIEDDVPFDKVLYMQE